MPVIVEVCRSGTEAKADTSGSARAPSSPPHEAWAVLDLTGVQRWSHHPVAAQGLFVVLVSEAGACCCSRGSGRHETGAC